MYELKESLTLLNYKDKLFMKKIIIIIINIFLIFSVTFAQEVADIYLKDGSTLTQITILEAKNQIIKAENKYSGNLKFHFNDIKNIIFNDGAVNKKGIVLIDGTVSGKLQSYENMEWIFLLPSGYLKITKPNRILSINFMYQEAEIQTLPDNIQTTSIIEWMEKRCIVEPDIVKDANVTLKIIKTVITSDNLLITYQTSSIDNMDKKCRVQSYWIDDKERMSETISQELFFPIRKSDLKTISYDPIITDASSIVFFFSFGGNCLPNNWFSTPPVDIKWLKSKQ